MYAANIKNADIGDSTKEQRATNEVNLGEYERNVLKINTNAEKAMVKAQILKLALIR